MTVGRRGETSIRGRAPGLFRSNPARRWLCICRTLRTLDIRPRTTTGRGSIRMPNCAPHATRGPDPNPPLAPGPATRLRAARPRLGLSSRGRLLSNGGSRQNLYGFTEQLPGRPRSLVRAKTGAPTCRTGCGRPLPWVTDGSESRRASWLPRRRVGHLSTRQSCPDCWSITTSHAARVAFSGS